MFKMHKILLFSTCILLHCSTHAQLAVFERLFGDTTDNCTAVSIVQVGSGNIFLATNNFPLVSGANLIKLYKYDRYGTFLNVFPIVTNGFSQVNKMKITPDGNLLLAGVLTDSTGNNDGLLLKTDTAGLIIWQNTFGRTFTNESLQGIDFTINGDIFSSGFTANNVGQGNAMYLIKTDSTGALYWDITYGSAFNSISDAVVSFADSTAIVSGDRLLSTGVYTNALIKIDTAGKVLWDFELPNPYNNGCKNDFLSSSGDLFIVGESSTASSFSFDPSITRIDTASNIKWNKIYNGSSQSTEAVFDIIEPITENFLAAGYGLNSTNNSADVLLLRIDSAGNETGRNFFGDSVGTDIGYSIINDAFGNGCFICGTSSRNGVNRGYLVYSDLLGIQNSIYNPTSELQQTLLYPNPAVQVVKVNALADYIEVFELTGKKVMSLKPSGSAHITSFDMQHLPKGIYIVKMSVDGKIVYGKIIKQ